MKVMSDDLYNKLLSFASTHELGNMLRDGEISVNDVRLAAGTGGLEFVPLPPPDHAFDFNGLVKWPWFSARRRGHLLERRVTDLEARILHLEQHLLSDLLSRAARKSLRVAGR
jgi:hypothetical protein